MKGILRQFILLPVLLIVAFNLLQLDMPIDKSVAAAQIMVRIVGPNSILLESYAVDKDKLASFQQTSDLTPDDNDKNPNALDAVLYATLQNSFDNKSYDISYNADYAAYYIHKLAGVSADHPDYWGTLILSASGIYDGGTLCAHTATAGDTYTVYYDKHTGTGTNYGNQSYACFQQESAHGGTGETITVGLITVGYDENWKTVASPLAGATIYATGPGLGENTAVAVTDGDGKAYIKFAAAGTYILTVSSDYYTYTRCTATIAGSDVALYEVSINVTDGANKLANAAFALTDQANQPCSAYAISAGTYIYRLTKGTYQYSASAAGYISSSGTLDISENKSQDICLAVKDTYTVTITLGGGEPETIMVRNSSGTQQVPVSAAGGVLQYELADGNYSYTVSRVGFHSTFSSFTVNGAAQNLNVPALTDTAAANAEWSSWRNASDNMAVTASTTAQGTWQAQEKWAASLGELGTWGTLSTSNMILYDGYLYIATEHGLSKLDSSSGQLIATAPLSGDASYVSQIAFGGGKVFATTAAGLDAFDALTMERLWSCSDFDTFGSSYMGATPLFYDNGTVYVGNYGCSTYNSLGTYGGYSAIDANNGQIKWNFWGGKDTVSYGAGAVKQGNYLIFGSEDGFLRAIDLNAVETNASHSLLAQPLELPVNGAIRSSVVSAGGYLYFTTSSGYIYKVAVDGGEFKVKNSAQFASASTSTPLIYNGRIYVGASDGIYVLNASDLSQVSHFTTSAPVLSSALLSSAYGGIVYAYFTVNSARGEIMVLTDDGTKVENSTLYEPSQSQYCLNSLIADDKGVIYYSNDSGYVFAVNNNLQPKEGLTAATISVSPAVIHEGSSTIYPDITVKNSSGTNVATTVPGTYYLAAGDYSYTVSLSGYQTATGSFTVTAADVAAGSKAIPVALAVPADNPTTPMLTVTFTLKDVDHAFSKTVIVASESTVKDVFVKAMNTAGVDYTLRSGGYVETIDGLSEGDKGANSGWMFKVNGSHPSVGITDYYVESGDEIIFHFSGDYTEEEDEQEWPGEDPQKIEEIPGPAQSASSFTDVASDAWYYEAIDFVIERDLFSGTGPDTFEPDRNMTRAMFVTVLARLSGADLSTFNDPAFSDVQGNAWYAAAVAWAADNGIVDGVGDGRFAPDEEITREQMCTLLMRYAAKSGVQLAEAGNANEFNDEGTISGWSLEKVNMARQAGLIQGKADNCFDPQGVLTRAEAATIFMRFVQNTVVQ